MEDAADLKSAPREGVWVRIPSSAPASFSYENRPPEQFRGGTCFVGASGVLTAKLTATGFEKALFRENLPHFLGGLPLGFLEDVRVSVESHNDGAVTQGLHYFPGLDPLGDHQAGAGVSQIMEPVAA